jgi:serine/threonine protein kinase
MAGPHGQQGVPPTEEILTPDRPNLYHFKLDRILGRGGTGVVYRGIDPAKGGVFAIKRFHENFFRNAMHIRDLKGSLKKFRKLEHQNVVRIYDFLDSDPKGDGYCMVMEYVDGPNLNWYLKNRPYKLQERVNVAQQLCSGLQYLHDQGCVHHDFKPANVLFTRRGIAKVADFSLYGSSFLLELLAGKVAEQVTPMFVAPEIIRREKPTDKVDQYALGVTLYMLFAERFPYVADNLPKLYQLHLSYTPMHPHEANPVCPQAIGDIIMKLLAKRPEQRFGDCDQVRIALNRAGASRI